MTDKAKTGDTVKVHYTGTFPDGTKFDSSEGKPALKFKIGENMVIKGFEDAIVGMAPGEEKDITIEPKDAYGDPDPSRKIKAPREQLPKEPEPKEGMILLLKGPNGEQFPAKIVGLTDTEVEIDVNHPLAGKTLQFKLKLEGICGPDEADECCGDGSCGDKEDGDKEGCGKEGCCHEHKE